MKIKFHHDHKKKYFDIVMSYRAPNNNIVGQVWVMDVGHKNSGLEVNNLSVVSKHKRKGYATKLMNRVVQYYGHRDLYLRAYPFRGGNVSKHDLQTFYQSFGFRVVRYSWKFGTLMKRDAQ
jgi:GNAT superfamily N-acetyltransferase